MSEQVHAAHCCARHGCKYGKNACPVVEKTVQQEFPCEFCSHDENDTVDAIIVWLLRRVREIREFTYPDEQSALDAEVRAHHYEDVVRGMRMRSWKN